MKWVKFLVRVVVLAAVVAAFFGIPYCKYAVKAQGMIWGLTATIVFGRFFCDAICPLGIIQSFVNWAIHPKGHARRVCTRLPETKAQRICRWSILGLAIALAAIWGLGAVSMILPISIIGKAIVGWWPGVMVLVIVLILATIGKGRIWCNWICPFGTIYNVVGKVSICRNRIGAGCGNCKRCFEKREGDGEKKSEESGGGEGTSRRAVLKGMAALAVADKFTDGGYAPIVFPEIPERECSILPPGAGDRRRFSLKCVGCQLCIANCPGECLTQSVKFSSLGQPEMVFDKGYCLSECKRCAEVCPELALGDMVAERKDIHVGVAELQEGRCLRMTGVEKQCMACVRKCPMKAIHIIKGVPVVDEVSCIGCGACEHVCPTRPMPAMVVKGYDTQKIIKPIGVEDLMGEMRHFIREGYAAVVAKDRVIIAKYKGSGLKPILDAIGEDEQIFKGAIVFDRIVGRAAAAVYIVGGAKEVYAEVMSIGAKKLLEKNKIMATGEQEVEEIINREKTGMCPLENSVKNESEPRKMYEILKGGK